MDRLLIVPAAGAGSRLGGPLPKLLVPVNGRPMIDHVLDLHARFVDHVALVVNPQVLPQVRSRVAQAAMPVTYLTQASPTGMLDAILIAMELASALQPRRVWITWCDQIALLPETLSRVRAAEDKVPAPAIVLPTCRVAEPYVHFDRDTAGRITGVRHRREGDAMPEAGETDAGLFALSLDAYCSELPQYAPARGARTGERNFLPFVVWMASRAEVVTVACELPVEAVGINTPEERARIEAHLRARESRA